MATAACQKWEGRWEQLVGKAKGIYRVNHGNLVNNIFYFIALQMTDHVPLDI